MAGLVYLSTASTGPNAHPSRYVKRGPLGVYALNAKTGQLVWQHREIGQYAPIVADEERVYVIGSTRVYAVEPRRPRKRR
jgi:outer membrane protein assembly factor BamB